MSSVTSSRESCLAVPTHAAATTARLGLILVAGIERGIFRPMNVPACTLAIGGILHIFIRGHSRRPGRFSRDEIVQQVLDYYVNGLLSNPITPARERNEFSLVPTGDD